MKRVFLFVCLLFLIFTYRADAETLSPSLRIITPDDEIVVGNTVKLEFDVKNFELTGLPIKKENAGVIGIYVDGKFFTNSASTSAQLYIPRVGTHFIEAELNYVNRDSVVPRVSDSKYLHIQKKSPYLRVKNLHQSETVYIDKPTIAIDQIQNVYEDLESYYQVFLDGQVDGDSKDSVDSNVYTIQKPLSVGSHSLRLVLYNPNGSAHLPTVDYQFNFNYSDKIPVISSVSIENATDETIDGSKNFSANLENFKIPSEGYLLLKYVQNESVFATMSGTIKAPKGVDNISFSLLNRSGRELVPSVSKEVVVPVVTPLGNNHRVNTVLTNGIFEFNEGVSVRFELLIAAFFEAVIIVLVATYMTHRHHRRVRTG